MKVLAFAIIAAFVAAPPAWDQGLEPAKTLPYSEQQTELEFSYHAALAAAEKLNKNSVLVGRLLGSLGVLYKGQAKYQKADEYVSRSLVLLESILGAHHREVGVAANNLGEIRRVTGRPQEAERLCRRSVEILEEAGPSAHLQLTTALNSLGIAMLGQNRTDEAEALFKRSLSVRPGPPEDSLTATVLDNLGEVYKRRDRFSESESVRLRSVAIRETVLPANDPELALSLNNLGCTYIEMERFAAAEPLLQRALAIRERSFGSEHPITAESRNNLAAVYFGLRRWIEAEPLLRSALQTAEHSEDPNILLISSVLRNLGVLYSETGRSSAAIVTYERLLVMQRTQNQEPTSLGWTLNHLGVEYSRLGRNTQAERCLREALALAEVCPEPKQCGLSSNLYYLAEVYVNEKEFLKAEPLFKRLLSETASEPSKLPVVLARYSYVMRRLNRKAEAKNLEMQARRMSRQSNSTFERSSLPK